MLQKIMMEGKIYEFLAAQHLAVVATVDGQCFPEAALVAFAVSPELEIVFDTRSQSRKFLNLTTNPHIALVIGLGMPATMQIEGLAVALDPAKDADLLEIYYRQYPDGRARAQNWPDLVHIKVVPKWIRYCDYTGPLSVKEYTL